MMWKWRDGIQDGLIKKVTSQEIKQEKDKQQQNVTAFLTTYRKN